MTDKGWQVIFAKGYLYFKKELGSKTMKYFNLLNKYLLSTYSGDMMVSKTGTFAGVIEFRTQK